MRIQKKKKKIKEKEMFSKFESLIVDNASFVNVWVVGGCVGSNV